MIHSMSDHMLFKTAIRIRQARERFQNFERANHGYLCETSVAQKRSQEKHNG